MSKRKNAEVDKPHTPVLKPMTFALPTISPIKFLNSHPQAEESLLQAASSGDIRTVRHLLDMGVDINVKDKTSGKTPLMRALLENHNFVAKTLITKNADLNIQDKFSNTALFLAASVGNLEMVEALIFVASTWEEAQYKAFLDQPHRMYGSSLQVALGNGNAQIVKILVNAGARVVEGLHLKASNVFSSTMDMDKVSEMMTPDASEDKPLSLLPKVNELMLSDPASECELSGYTADTEFEY